MQLLARTSYHLSRPDRVEATMAVRSGLKLQQHADELTQSAPLAALLERGDLSRKRELTLHRWQHHCGARSTRRPGAALWWNCSAINSDFIARSGHSVVARIKGSHSAAWTQNGG